MKIAVLGATGAMGSLAVDTLLARGHDVVAVSRSPISLREPAAHFAKVVGDLTDTALLHKAIEDCDAVISCLGQSRSSTSLFAKRISPPDILRRVAAASVAAIGSGQQHLIYLSAFGVGEDRKRHALLFRIVLRLSSINDAYLDHAEAETAIRESQVRWTIVRPPGLTEKDANVTLIDKSDRWSSFETVSKRSLANFLVQCAEQQGPLMRVMAVGEIDR